eukprot:Lankesteria_metandrocarpae@DN4561_c0_g1_i9.p2
MYLYSFTPQLYVISTDNPPSQLKVRFSAGVGVSVCEGAPGVGVVRLAFLVFDSSGVGVSVCGGAPGVGVVRLGFLVFDSSGVGVSVCGGAPGVGVGCLDLLILDPEFPAPTNALWLKRRISEQQIIVAIHGDVVNCILLLCLINNSLRTII